MKIFKKLGSQSPNVTIKILLSFYIFFGENAIHIVVLNADIAKLQRRRQELTQTTPDQLVDDEAVYYKVASDCPKGCVYSLRSLWRKKRIYGDPDASTSQVLAQREMGNFMILRLPFTQDQYRINIFYSETIIKALIVGLIEASIVEGCGFKINRVHIAGIFPLIPGLPTLNNFRSKCFLRYDASLEFFSCLRRDPFDSCHLCTFIHSVKLVGDNKEGVVAKEVQISMTHQGVHQVAEAGEGEGEGEQR
ncbi:hypothetical protein Syun_001346 [Stephania yunnanensis]|uniref:WDR11 first beta-propeller domain-containing protein n=1 Tax=Stephania yunnanensis TaxID=152371 RepID=A0AAP0LDR6_9MAGN